MSPLAFNPFPAAIAIMAAFGVFMHDTQLDTAIVTAVSTIPAIMASNGEVQIKTPDPHIHAERHTFALSGRHLRTNQPAIQPRNENDKKYVIQKRLWGNSFGSDYSWPSI